MKSEGRREPGLSQALDLESLLWFAQAAAR
jgi:hypothetical protein